MAAQLETATLAGGCFWCLEAVFDEVTGVTDVVSGYCGGTVRFPDYEQVCAGTTGHAEAVQLTFDPQKISYEDLLGIFFSIHDPTTLNRQGADVGTQYRSAIYYHNDSQKETAESMIADLERQGTWGNPVVTEVVALPEFFPAEDYHQEYFARHPGQGYCSVVIAPKVAKFRHKYARFLRA